MIAVKAAALLGEDVEAPESCPEKLRETKKEFEKMQKLNLLLLILLALLILYELFGKRKKRGIK